MQGKIAPRTGDSCQSLYLNWLPLYHCQETLNPETSCGDVKFACLYSSLALAWRTASCKAPNTNKIQPQKRSVKGFYPDATSLCHRGLVKNINALKLASKNVDMFDVFCATNDRQWIKQLPPPSVPRILIMERLLTPNLGWKQSCQGSRTPSEACYVHIRMADLDSRLRSPVPKESSRNPPTRFGVHSLLFLCSIQNFVTRCPSKIPSPKSKIQDPQNPKSKIPKIQNPKSPKSKIQNPQIPKSKLCT